MPAARFPRALRLTEAEQYQRAFRGGRRLNDSNFTVVAVANGQAYPRLGLAISRKAARRAVDRNRLKRLIRESFRRAQTELAGWDLVVIAKPAARGHDNTVLRTSLGALWHKLTHDATRGDITD